MVLPGRSRDDIIRRMRFAGWTHKATDTHSEYVILIPFPRQQWLRERGFMLRYTYIDCLATVKTCQYFENSDTCPVCTHECIFFIYCT